MLMIELPTATPPLVMTPAYKETDITIRIRSNRYYSAEYRIAVHPTIRSRSEYEANIRYSPNSNYCSLCYLVLTELPSAHVLLSAQCTIFCSCANFSSMCSLELTMPSSSSTVLTTAHCAILCSLSSILFMCSFLSTVLSCAPLCFLLLTMAGTHQWLCKTQASLCRVWC